MLTHLAPRRRRDLYNRGMPCLNERASETLGQRIARLRAARGWTQSDLASRLSMSRVAVSHFEMGLAVPSERTVILLAGLFKLEPHDLVEATSYPVAKVERLAMVACRYTEVELQLALLDRDLEWLERLSPGDTVEHLAAHTRVYWVAKLDQLSEDSTDRDERRLLQRARQQLSRRLAMQVAFASSLSG